MSTSILEYPSYDESEHCLDDREALERFRSEKAANPGALVTLNELHCGEHWRVKVYSTKAEKDRYLRRIVKRMAEKFEEICRDLEKSHESTTSPR